MTILPKKNLIIIGGLPGSGKTHLGAMLSEQVGLFLDKDTVSRFFSEFLLEILGKSPNDRESPEYLEKVRPLEYKTLIKIAKDNLAASHSVVCSAPFIKEFCDSDWVEKMQVDAELSDSTCYFLWMNSDEETLHERIRNRNAGRDLWKLANWNTWYASVPKDPPTVTIPDLVVFDNRMTAGVSLQQQIATFLAHL
ncbi:AAA family ATPase [Acidithiobacillus ferrianus]|jgi:predicted kinase|uniref:AAA family ATPase n=1 Tax=Acidithiobacillus ferrianus TaxID=2678518 RepID=UPI0034E41850